MAAPEEDELTAALRQFGAAFAHCEAWVGHRRADFGSAHINTVSQLAAAVSESGVNERLTAAGVPAERLLSLVTVRRLRRFMPGSLSKHCLKIAREAGRRVRDGRADTKYQHRGDGVGDQSRGDERWEIGDEHETWVMHVDCAGFVRNVLESAIGSQFVASVSDRRFMRAKDFRNYFAALPLSVVDQADGLSPWRRVDDLRTLLPGDIVAWSYLRFLLGKIL